MGPRGRRIVPGAAIYQDLVPITVSLGAIHLDPNNPRFVGPNWQQVEDDQIDSDKVQDEVRRVLVHDYAVDKLRMNMEVNGYLPIDRIVVRKFKPEKYVVLEGNRRVAAAKMISKVATDGTTVSEDVLRSLIEIPCLEYVGMEQEAAWIFQGLRHITGIVEWSSYNKARLLVEQMEEEGLNLTEAGKRFGLTGFGAGQWVRGYYAFKQAREESDYIREIDQRAYPYFQELFSRSSSAVRDWIGWDDEEYRFKDALKFNEFIGWLYPRAGGEAGDEETLGDWERRKLSRGDDIRALAFLLTHSEKYFEQFRNGNMDVKTAYVVATAEAFRQESAESADRVKEVFDALSAAAKALEDIPWKILKDDALKQDLNARLDRLERLIGPLKQSS